MNFRSPAPWLLAVATVIAFPAFAHDYQVGALKIDHPWSRLTVAGQRAGGAFLTVRNAGSDGDRLVGASSPAAERVEMHTMKLEGDVMRMREVPALDLPAGATVSLQPGGNHLMLMGLKAPLKAGERVPLTLRFEKAGEVKVELAVEAAATAAPTQPAAGHHHAH